MDTLLVQLRNYYTLHLNKESVSFHGTELTTREGIKNIHHLKISSSSFRTTKGLMNITGSLTLSGAWSLRSLEGVKNIPVVTITCATYLSDFTELGNHQEHVKISQI
jgi:hypothetical protein